MVKKLFAVFFLVLILSACVFGEEKAKIIFLHTNDMHGHMIPYENSRIANPPDMVGGFQYLATLIKQERAKNPGKVLLLDGGDIAQGTIYSNLSYGMPMVDLMNFVRYDAWTIGNHELDWGEEKLERLISSADFPVLSCNIVRKENGRFLPGAKPYIIKDMSGIRVGIIGVSSPDTSVLAPYSNSENFYFLPAEDAVKSFIPVLKFIHKADLIVVLSHLGLRDDKELAEKVPDLDIIIGGHSHSVLDKPVKIGKTVIYQAGNYLAYLGKLEVEFDIKNKKITDYKGSLIKIIDSQIEPDPETAFIVNTYKDKYDVIAKKVVGNAIVPLTKSNTMECNIGNFFADMIKEFGKADVGLINSAGIREEIPVGDITMEKVYSVYPFDNIIFTMDLKGSDLQKVFQNCIEGKHSILQVSSGLKVKYDLTGGQKKVEILINNKPLDPDALYKVATVDFLALGGDGYEGFKTGKNLERIMLVRDAFVTYLSLKSPVKSSIEGRIEFVK